MLNRAEPTSPLHCHILPQCQTELEGGMGNERKIEMKVLYSCHWWNSPTKGAKQAEHESEGNRGGGKEQVDRNGEWWKEWESETTVIKEVMCVRVWRGSGGGMPHGCAIRNKSTVLLCFGKIHAKRNLSSQSFKPSCI